MLCVIINYFDIYSPTFYSKFYLELCYIIYYLSGIICIYLNKLSQHDREKMHGENSIWMKYE